MTIEQDLAFSKPSTLENPQSRKSSSVTSHGHENLGFEHAPLRRKISTVSDHAKVGPVRKKSALHNMHNAENGLSGFSGMYLTCVILNINRF